MLWLSIALGGTATVSLDEKALSIEVSPEDGWELAEGTDRGMTAMLGIGERKSKMSTESLSITVPGPILKQTGIEGLTSIGLQTHFNACRKADGVCKSFVLEGSAPLVDGNASFTLGEMEDRNAYLEGVAQKQRMKESKPDPAFAKQDEAYYAAMAQGTAEALDAAAKRAKKRRVPLIASFGFEGCKPCLQLAREVWFADPSPVDLSGVELVLINTMHKDSAPLSERMDLAGVPIVMWMSKGKEVERIRGYAGDPTSVRELVQRATSKR